MSSNVRVAGLRLCASLVIAVAIFTVPPALAAEQKTPPPGNFGADSPEVKAGTARERERFERRKSADAKRDRVASRKRYRGSSRGEAIALGRRFFPEAFVAPLFDGATMAPGLELVGYRGTDAAIAEQADGTKLLLQSTLPLRTRTAKRCAGARRLVVARECGGVHDRELERRSSDLRGCRHGRGAAGRRSRVLSRDIN